MLLVSQRNSNGIRIILSGLTACGKSTHAASLASRYEVDHHAMRPIMRAVSEEVFQGSGPEPDLWTPTTDERRAHDDYIDRESDRRMVAAITAGPGVFDAWALPWLCDRRDAVRVWIEADLASRAERCVLSYEAREIDPPDDPYALLEEKDSFSRRQFRNLYGVELGPDPEVFDLIAENSKPMSERTLGVAKEDARVFNELLHSRIQGILAAREEAGGAGGGG